MHMKVFRSGFMCCNKSLKEYLGFVYCKEILFDVFQLRFWSDDVVNNCVSSVAERQRERSAGTPTNK